jgi:hypothetical protein
LGQADFCSEPKQVAMKSSPPGDPTLWGCSPQAINPFTLPVLRLNVLAIIF